MDDKFYQDMRDLKLEGDRLFESMMSSLEQIKGDTHKALTDICECNRALRINCDACVCEAKED